MYTDASPFLGEVAQLREVPIEPELLPLTEKLVRAPTVMTSGIVTTFRIG